MRNCDESARARTICRKVELVFNGLAIRRIILLGRTDDTLDFVRLEPLNVPKAPVLKCTVRAKNAGQRAWSLGKKATENAITGIKDDKERNGIHPSCESDGARGVNIALYCALSSKVNINAPWRLCFFERVHTENHPRAPVARAHTHACVSVYANNRPWRIISGFRARTGERAEKLKRREKVPPAGETHSILIGCVENATLVVSCLTAKRFHRSRGAPSLLPRK